MDHKFNTASRPTANQSALEPTKRTSNSGQRLLPYRDIALVLLYATAIPFSIYLAIAIVSTVALGRLLTVVATAYALTALALLFEAAVANRRKYAPALTNKIDAQATSSQQSHPYIPAVTAVVAAYLPNEKDIILQTLSHLLLSLDIPRNKLQVILAYNTPERLPIEGELNSLAATDPRLLLLPVEGSKSKAENINAALPHATGEIVSIFDADHHPEPLCFQKALRWIRIGYDAVQGRCVIRNSHENWLTRLISVEFGTMYTVSHTARSLSVDTAIFGGSNGYWRKEALRFLRMDESMLTEDIDIGVRALLAGYRVVHDRSIVSTELAPTALSSWFYQRLRWAQGWYQVTLKHTRAIARSSFLNQRQKVYWLYMLAWREIYAAVSPQAPAMLLSVIVVLLAFGGRWYWDPYLTGTTILAVSAAVLVVLVSYKHSSHPEQRIRRADVIYFIALMPFLALAQNIITLIAWLRESNRQHEWIATSRGRTTS